MAGPFDDLQISDSSFLDQIEERIACDKCNRSRKYYCYTCFKPVGGIDDKLPKVQLPLSVDIIKHPNEIDGKSTAAHAAILAPDHVTVYTYPCIPDYKDKSKVLLIFPGKDAMILNELRRRLFERHRGNKTEYDSSNSNSCETPQEETGKGVTKDTSSIPESEKRTCSDSEDLVPPPLKKQKTETSPYEKVVFIDSTWAQTTKISKDERLKGLTRVELQSHVTRFWRHQKDKPDTYLATIEAIYYFFTEFHAEFLQTESEYTGQYDNLLFFFKYLHQKLWQLYDGEKPKRANQQKKDQSDAKKKT